MCRCEVVLYLQKLRDLEDRGVDLQIPNGLSESPCPLIGSQRPIDIHPRGTVLYDY